jgi:hypothetical protein
LAHRSVNGPDDHPGRPVNPSSAVYVVSGKWFTRSLGRASDFRAHGHAPDRSVHEASMDKNDIVDLWHLLLLPHYQLRPCALANLCHTDSMMIQAQKPLSSWFGLLH